jgi:hypothetical protein
MTNDNNDNDANCDDDYINCSGVDNNDKDANCDYDYIDYSGVDSNYNYFHCDDEYIDYSGVDNNYYEDNDDSDKVTNRLRKTMYFSGPLYHDHKLTWRNMSLYEMN